MKRLAFFIVTFSFFCFPLFGQVDTANINSKGIQIGISNAELIEEFLPLIPGLGSNSREMLTEQSVKSYMMPPRRASASVPMESYALAALLEFYVNFQTNYKVNLSPDYISVSLAAQEKFNLKDAFEFLVAEGTVSAAIMPFDAKTIPRAVYATQKYRIKNYLKVVRPEMRAQQRVFETKKALMRGNPMLALIHVPEDFEDLTDTRYWISGKAKKQVLQPFIVVGYDQDLEAFEITSFWGNEWADNGYLWMEYDDFGKYIENGFVIIPSE